MKTEQLLESIKKAFSESEFTMAELLDAMFDESDKPRSNTSEYRAIMHALLAIEKYDGIKSRKIGSIKHYSLPSYKRPSERPKRNHADEYMRIREMVIEGLRTGKIPMFGANKDDLRALRYIQDNIAELVQRVNAPYQRIHVRRTPLYLELNPVM
ncbi:MAG: hypothetical protein QGG50_04105 [Methanopyri archaeon]|jgi:hypothetical protein|nr:hypothetical protein [Methanopyri archaeon]